jgi:hypothetical protein
LAFSFSFGSRVFAGRLAVARGVTALHATDHGVVTAFVVLTGVALDGGAPALDGRRLPRPRRPGHRVANTGSSSTGARPAPRRFDPEADARSTACCDPDAGGHN